MKHIISRKRGRPKKNKVTIIHQKVYDIIPEGVHNGITIRQIGDEIEPITPKIKASKLIGFATVGRDQRIR